MGAADFFDAFMPDSPRNTSLPERLTVDAKTIGELYDRWQALVLQKESAAVLENKVIASVHNIVGRINDEVHADALAVNPTSDLEAFSGKMNAELDEQIRRVKDSLLGLVKSYASHDLALQLHFSHDKHDAVQKDMKLYFARLKPVDRLALFYVLHDDVPLFNPLLGDPKLVLKQYVFKDEQFREQYDAITNKPPQLVMTHAGWRSRKEYVDTRQSDKEKLLAKYHRNVCAVGPGHPSFDSFGLGQLLYVPIMTVADIAGGAFEEANVVFERGASVDPVIVFSDYCYRENKSPVKDIPWSIARSKPFPEEIAMTSSQGEDIMAHMLSAFANKGVKHALRISPAKPYDSRFEK